MIIRIVKKKPAPKPQPPRTLAEAIERLKSITPLTDARRRDLISACNSLGRLIGLPLESILTDVAVLRDALASVHPVQGRISTKRLSNIKSDLAAALLLTDVLPADDPDVEPSDQWVTFMAHAKEPYQRWSLARFSRFCSLRKIEPEDVDDTTLRSFAEYLDARVVAHDPRTTVKAVGKAFNAIVTQNSIPLNRLSTAAGTNYVTAPISAYPPSLQADLAAYLQRLEKPDLFSDDGPDRALRPKSLRNIEAHIRQLLQAAVDVGFPLDRFQTLADLLDLQVLGRAFDGMIERFGGRVPTSLPNILATLLAIAKYHVGSPPELRQKLRKARKGFADRLGSNSPRMSEKAARRLEQFDDERNVELLVDLPYKLIKRAAKAPGTQRSTIDATCATAIAILFACPMRAEDLAELELGADIQAVQRGKKTYYLLHIAGEKTKNGAPIVAEIKPPLSKVVAAYLKNHRKFAADDPGPWVFPRPSGGPQTPDHFAEKIKHKIAGETGLDVNAHLFRHLGVKLFLETYPGDYEEARRILAHKSAETTTQIYSPLSNRAAFNRYNAIIEDYRGEDL